MQATALLLLSNLALVISFTSYLPFYGMKKLKDPWTNVVDKGCKIHLHTTTCVNYELTIHYVYAYRSGQ